MNAQPDSSGSRQTMTCASGSSAVAASGVPRMVKDKTAISGLSNTRAGGTVNPSSHRARAEPKVGG